MNFIAPGTEPLIREIPLSRLALAPENVRKTPPDPRADAELKASIAALGLLENLVVRVDEPGEDPGSPTVPWRTVPWRTVPTCDSIAPGPARAVPPLPDRE